MRAQRTARATRGAFLASLLVLFAGCGACGDHGETVAGDVPYVRCAAVDPPEESRGRTGSVSYRVDDRTLKLDGLPRPYRIGAFRGAGDATARAREALAGLSEQGVGLVFVLGGLGTKEASVRVHLEALASLGVPVVVVVGGDDDARAVADAMDDPPERVRGRVFDGRRLRTVRVGDDSFLLVHGAPGGRYASTSTHCGAGQADLEAVVEAAPREGRRFLVSWAAPSGGGAHGVGRGFGDVDAGDAEIASIARRANAPGGIFAWPGTRVALPSPADGSRVLAAGEPDPTLRIVVNRLAGPPEERGDGALVPAAAAVLEMSAAGLAFVGSAAPGEAP